MFGRDGARVCGVVAGFVLGLLPLLWEHCRNVSRQPEFHYLPYVLGSAAALAWHRVRLSQSRTPRIGTGGRDLATVELSLLGLALGLLGVAVVLHSPVVAVVTGIVLAAVGVLVVQRACDVVGLWGCWGLLWLCLTTPLGYGGRVVGWLQQTSSVLSEQVLDFVGIDHLMRGNVLCLPNAELFVNEACSGIVSVRSVIAFAAVWGVWKCRGLVHFISLCAISVGWALLLNVVRICIIAIALDRLQLDLTEQGRGHWLLGTVCISVTFLAILSSDKLLTMLLAPIELPAGVIEKIESWNVLVRWWNHGLPKHVVQACRADMGCASFGIALISSRSTQSRSSQSHSAQSRSAQSRSAQSHSNRGLIGQSSWAGIVSSQRDNEAHEFERRVQEGCSQRLTPERSLFRAAALASLCFVGAGVYQLRASFQYAGTVLPRVHEGLDVVHAIRADVMPERVGSWRRLGGGEEQRQAGHLFGAFSNFVHYVDDATGLKAMVSIDFPFSNWHELPYCYRAVGWEPTSRNQRMLRDARAINVGSYADAEFRRYVDEHAYLAFALVDSQGELCDAGGHGTSGTYRLLDRLADRFQAKRVLEVDATLFQVQTWLTATGPIDPSARESARQLFLVAVELVRARLRDRLEPSSVEAN